MKDSTRSRAFFPAAIFGGIIIGDPRQRGANGPMIAECAMFDHDSRSGEPGFQTIDIARFRAEIPAAGTVIRVKATPQASSRNGNERPFIDAELLVHNLAEAEMPEEYRALPVPHPREPRAQRSAPGGDTAPVSTFAQDPNKLEDW